MIVRQYSFLVPLLVAAATACSSSTSAPSDGGAASCTIASGSYDFQSTASGGPDCISGSYTIEWPPTVMVDGGSVPETCTTSEQNDQCQVTCAPPAGTSGPTTATTYTLTSSGFSGTSTSPVSSADGGAAYTCTYMFTATRK